MTQILIESRNGIIQQITPSQNVEVLLVDYDLAGRPGPRPQWFVYPITPKVTFESAWVAALKLWDDMASAYRQEVPMSGRRR